MALPLAKTLCCAEQGLKVVGSLVVGMVSCCGKLGVC